MVYSLNFLPPLLSPNYYMACFAYAINLQWNFSFKFKIAFEVLNNIGIISVVTKEDHQQKCCLEDKLENLISTPMLVHFNLKIHNLLFLKASGLQKTYSTNISWDCLYIQGTLLRFKILSFYNSTQNIEIEVFQCYWLWKT